MAVCVPNSLFHWEEARREERRWILDRVCIKQEWHTGPKVNFPEMCLEGKLQEI